MTVSKNLCARSDAERGNCSRQQQQQTEQQHVRSWHWCALHESSYSGSYVLSDPPNRADAGRCRRENETVRLLLRAQDPGTVAPLDAAA
jgi:hypothetical protein